MGGLTFSEDLNVPRLAPDQYKSLKQKYHDVLQEFYNIVVTPHEAPCKADYGDIDFLVAEPRNSKFNMEDLKDALKADRHLKTSTNSFGIPISTLREEYVQVDVKVCQSTEHLRWTNFRNSYGDLWQILGLMIRKFGLTPDDKGLVVRVPQIETNNKQKSKIRLTSEPAVCCSVLGLNYERYEMGFDSTEEVFEWATSCRFFSPKKFQSISMNANDRKRMMKRAMFTQFVNVWTAKYPNTIADPLSITREDVLQEMLDRFNQRDRYDEMLRLNEKAEEQAIFWKAIAASITLNNEKKGLAMAGLKKRIRFENGQIRVMKTLRLGNIQPEVSKSEVDEEAQRDLIDKLDHGDQNQGGDGNTVDASSLNEKRKDELAEWILMTQQELEFWMARDLETVVKIEKERVMALRELKSRTVTQSMD